MKKQTTTKESRDLSLESRVERLEAELAEMKALVTKLREIKQESPRPKAKGDAKKLITQLNAANKAGEKKLATKIRRQLRATGYSLRTNNKK